MDMVYTRVCLRMFSEAYGKFMDFLFLFFWTRDATLEVSLSLNIKNK
jgi:hypothetical protein